MRPILLVAAFVLGTNERHRSKLPWAPRPRVSRELPHRLGCASWTSQHAERALALLDAHAVPALSRSDSEPYRGEIRRGARKVLERLNSARAMAGAGAVYYYCNNK